MAGLDNDLHVLNTILQTVYLHSNFCDKPLEGILPSVHFNDSDP